MSFTNNSAKLSRANQLSNIKGKEKIIDDKLKKAREKRFPKINQNTSPVKDTTNARNAKIQKNKNKQIGELKRKNTQAQKKLDLYINNSSRSAEASPSPNNKNYQKLLSEKMSNSKKYPSRRRYSQRTMIIAALLILTSLPCYNLLRKFDIWPSQNAVKARLGASYVAATEQLINLDNLKATVENYRKQNNVDGKIKAILATDAVSLTPEIGISKKGLVTGLLQEEILKQSEMRILERKFKKFEEYCKSKKDVTITDAFIYHVQPVNSTLRSFVCYIHPSTQGKATDREVELLRTITKKLELEDFEIIGFVFDGDTTYSALHKTYFDEYYKMVKTNNNFNNFSIVTKQSIVSDPLHLLKRARYRLFSENIHAGLLINSPKLTFASLHEILDIPELVFSNKKYTKMQDSLPIHLFSFKSLITILNENQKDWITYMIPFSLLNIALSEKDLTITERRCFIEISFYYSLFYIAESQKVKHQLPQRKYKTNNIQMYSHALTLELCNTCFSILRVMDFFNGTINLNRFGSNPVEHIFGLLRMKSRYKNSFEKMKKVFGEIELHKQLLNDLGENQPISGRKTYYGQSVFNIVNGTKDIFEYCPRDIAFSLHIANSLPFEKIEFKMNDVQFLLKSYDKILDNFYSTMKVIYLRLNPKERANKLNSHEIHISTGKNIINRISDKKIVQ